ncbi:putative tRNA 2'-phosphotransferase 1 [Amylocarpus encephaloides]|uniref:2'-phosphotransferase n=1 Tax=Amylocarpus encephaloides TaxID=45428 RepID=A0A9P7YE16_9HELO|nr:putative tRNA 2'-phosphotransferase 1 [Amylocarpus encephaloides]
MAAAVMAPMQGLSLDGGIMPPSPASQNSSRHGRSKHGGSVVKKGRGRGYSVIDDREVTISKALNWVLKRTIKKGEAQEEGTEEKLVADAEGWVDCEEVLAKPNLVELEVTFDELKSVVTSSKSRFAVKLKPDSEEDEETDESDYLIRMIASAAPATTPSASTQKFTPISTTTEDLPTLIVYETSYANYPLILASGGIKRAGGQAHLQFASIKVDEDGTEVKSSSGADVSIYINLRELMEAEPSMKWARTESGNVVTEGDSHGGLGKNYWKKAVGRRADIGVLYEDGVAKKEVPVGLRGKGAKGKKGLKGKWAGMQKKEMKATSEDDSASE